MQCEPGEKVHAGRGEVPVERVPVCSPTQWGMESLHKEWVVLGSSRPLARHLVSWASHGLSLDLQLCNVADSNEGSLDAVTCGKVLGEVFYRYTGLLYDIRHPKLPFF